MNSKLFRCGWCGSPTDAKGIVLPPILFERVRNLIEKYGDHHSQMTDGDCCEGGYERHQRVRVTRDMAIDAGDLNLEGQWIKW